MAPHTILFIAANPVGTDQRALEEQARAVQVELERAGRRECFQFETRWAAQPLDLLREMVRHKPTVVHFCGGRVIGGANGARPAGVYFQAADGRPQLVPAKALANAFDAAGSVKLVVLDACYSEEHAAAVAARVDCVVGMLGETVDSAAMSFAIGLYGGLGEGESVAAAFKQGCAAIGLTGAGDSGQPQLQVRTGVDASGLVLTERREASDRERVDADVERGEPLPSGGARQRGIQAVGNVTACDETGVGASQENVTSGGDVTATVHHSSSSRYAQEAMSTDADANQDRRADRRSETTYMRDVLVVGLPALVAVMVSVTSLAEKLVPGAASVKVLGPCVAALCLAIGAAYVVTSRCKRAGKLGGDVLEYRFASVTRYCAKILLLPAFMLFAVRVYQCLPYRFRIAWSEQGLAPLCGYVCGRGKPLEQAEVDVRDMWNTRIGLQLEVTDRSGYFCVDVSEWALPPERLRILAGGCKQTPEVEFSEARMASQCPNASEEPVRKGVHRVWEVECEVQ